MPVSKKVINKKYIKDFTKCFIEPIYKFSSTS